MNPDESANGQHLPENVSGPWAIPARQNPRRRRPTRRGLVKGSIATLSGLVLSTTYIKPSMLTISVHETAYASGALVVQPFGAGQPTGRTTSPTALPTVPGQRSLPPVPVPGIVDPSRSIAPIEVPSKPATGGPKPVDQFQTSPPNQPPSQTLVPTKPPVSTPTPTNVPAKVTPPTPTKPPAKVTPPTPTKPPAKAATPAPTKPPAKPETSTKSSTPAPNNKPEPTKKPGR